MSLDFLPAYQQFQHSLCEGVGTTDSHRATAGWILIPDGNSPAKPAS
jgi:hypothetical protein